MTPDFKRRYKEDKYPMVAEPVFTITELQFKQRKGETLTREDMGRIKKFSEAQRKKKLSKK